jgi:hypothetical protein
MLSSRLLPPSFPPAPCPLLINLLLLLLLQLPLIIKAALLVNVHLLLPHNELMWLP